MEMLVTENKKKKSCHIECDKDTIYIIASYCGLNFPQYKELQSTLEQEFF